jgi:hypothetical protein
MLQTSRTGIGVNSGFQTQAVNITGDVGHIAVSLATLDSRPLLWVHDDMTCWVALTEPPTLVDDDILVPGFFSCRF